MSAHKGYSSFYDFLKEEVNQFRGPVEDYIFYLPALFRTLSGVLDQPELSPPDRNKVLCALGYLVAPNDVIPEEVFGAAGYVDDVFILSHVLQHTILSTYGEKFALPFWEMEGESLSDFLTDTLERTTKSLGDKAKLVLECAGL